jgi:pimeloyl-ACP methyl ester carboxylesterase
VAAEDAAPAAPSALLRTIADSRRVRETLVGAFLANPQFTRALLRKFIDDPAKATDDWVEVYRRPLHVTGTTAAVAAWLPALLLPDAVALSERPASYRSLKTRFFVVWGERDAITPLDQGERLARLVPAAQLTVMKGVGHIPQIEDAAGFEELLRQLVATASSASSSP